MKFGKLNEWEPNIHLNFSYENGIPMPEAKTPGNPLYDEPLMFQWEQVRDRRILFHFTFPKEYFIDSVLIQPGKKSEFHSAEVFHQGKLLYRHAAETSKSVKTDALFLYAGISCRELDLVFEMNFSHLQIEKIELFGGLEDGIDLFPRPAQFSCGENRFSVSRFSSLSSDSPLSEKAFSVLTEKYSEKTGILLARSDNGSIRFFVDDSIPSDGYSLSVTGKIIHIKASNERGFVYGAETLIKLIRDGMIPEIQVDDAPSCSFRGVHLFIPSEEKMEFAKRIIKYLISPMGYNTVILQVSGGMQYDSHPEIPQAFRHAVQMAKEGKWPTFPHSGIAEGKPITKEQTKEYIEYIRSFGIDVIPEVQSLAHVQYITAAHPEIAEIQERNQSGEVDTRIEDLLPSQFYHHDYCPSNDESYRILFDILDEIIEVFRPKEYVHMGHDEVRSIGLCEKCKNKTHAELFASDVNRIHDYLASKGLKMMIWADMLQPFPRYTTSPAIDMIPKDIVLLDFVWYFFMDQDIEENLLKKGFQVIYGNLYSSHFPRYQTRIQKQGILGGQISAWTATNEYEMQKEGKLYDLFLTAQMLWSAKEIQTHLPSYDQSIRALIPQLREHLNEMRYPSRQADSSVTVLFDQSEKEVREWKNSVGMKQVNIGKAFDSLIFAHTALQKMSRLPWTNLEIIGHYLITYENQETEKVEVTYDGNIGFFGKKQNDPIKHGAYRHTGYTATYYSDGETLYTEDREPMTIYRYEYLPKKKLPVSSVEFIPNPKYGIDIFVQKLEGIHLK